MSIKGDQATTEHLPGSLVSLWKSALSCFLHSSTLMNGCRGLVRIKFRKRDTH